MTVVFERVTLLPVPPETAFDASRDIDLHKRSMARSREEAVAGTTTGLIGPAQQVTWRARHFGVRFRMTSVISGYRRPLHFVDSQVRGPFAHFRHEHRFIADGGGTQMHDRVEFRAPFGPLGFIAERLVLARYMAELIDTRNEVLVRELSN